MTTKEIDKILEKLPVGEQNELRKGFELWHNLKVFEEFKFGGKVDNNTIKELMSNIIINTWLNSRGYFNKSKKIDKMKKRDPILDLMGDMKPDAT